MNEQVLLDNCLTTYTWGRKYCVEIFKTGRCYISYRGGHILLSDKQELAFMKMIEDLNPLGNNQSLFGEIIELPSAPKLSRWCIRIIHSFLREERDKLKTQEVKQEQVYLGKGKYIAKEDYNRVVNHYEAIKYGDFIEEEGG